MSEAKPPMVHLNGTSRDQLLDVREKAYYALLAAYDAVKGIAPNGRDYYPYGNGEFEKATDAQLSRLRRIDDVREEISQEMVSILEQER